jgi:hypothetical protein
MNDPCFFRFSGHANGPECRLRSKASRTLLALWVAQGAGCTTKDVALWANDLAHHIEHLRRRGFNIETELERDGGGRNSRYRLITPVGLITYSGLGESGFDDLLEDLDLDEDQVS